MDKNIKIIHFNSVKDIQNRICKLWIDQKEDEIYDFTFQDKEIEDQFNSLMKKFKAD